MLFTAVLFLIVAAGGLTMAGMKFSGKTIPAPLALGHGLLALVAVIFLFFSVFTNGVGTTLVTAKVFLLITALVGLVLFSFRAGKRSPPFRLILVHGTLAAIGITLLLVAFFA
ncbi:MAG: hypothetical protein IH614_00400 [Desulfuromonadales bacterium]|nr:hypothetical protein [Desulfuromonadales bacterium]